MPEDFSQWPPSRAVALAKLEQFVPYAGRDYASRRNYDRGRSKHSSVSTLSPWIRHRALAEAEVAAAVLDSHSRSAAEKYIQEVFWRTYWKGWLESRPQVWHRYNADLSSLHRTASDVVTRCETISQGNSGIECFDSWCRELIETGYLHNHARMWFASIWIFTLKLPWQLGADFFLRHLLDGDPASNTLSWRWVAGLQTVGKTYLARADNIEKYTEGRFAPVTRLATVAEALTEEPIGERIALPSPPAPIPDAVTGLLLTDEDLHPDFLLQSTALQNIEVSATATLQTTTRLSLQPVSALVTDFVQHLIDDALEAGLNTKAALTIGGDCKDSRESTQSALATQIVEWALQKKLQQVISPYAPVGPVADMLNEAEPLLKQEGIALRRVVRPWDAIVWPHASKGFFALKKKIPTLLDALIPEGDKQADRHAAPFQLALGFNHQRVNHQQ